LFCCIIICDCIAICCCIIICCWNSAGSMA
jgi:hypothetical protein